MSYMSWNWLSLFLHFFILWMFLSNYFTRYRYGIHWLYGLLWPQNCRFLQKGRIEGHESEVESVARLTEALREAKPLKVAITNWRKDGTAFRNLLAIKPIMDQNGDYVSKLLIWMNRCAFVVSTWVSWMNHTVDLLIVRLRQWDISII